MTTRDILMVNASGGTPPTPPAIADAFAITQYTGYAGSQTITTGINLADDGGLVWCRALGGSGYGVQKLFWQPQYGLAPNSESGTDAYGNMGTFTSSGFNLVYDWTNLSSGNQPDSPYVAWSWKRTPKIFDYVTWSGDDTEFREIPHNLDCAPGFIFMQVTTDGEYGPDAVRVAGSEDLTPPNYKASSFSSAYVGFDYDNVFALESLSDWTTAVKLSNTVNYCNQSGKDYIMFLWANDPTGNMSCGSYVGNGSTTGPSVTLGWQPQFLLIKSVEGYGYNWIIYDANRGMSVGDSPALVINSWTDFEQDFGNITTSSSGFQILSDDTNLNESGIRYSYMAIRTP